MQLHYLVTTPSGQAESISAPQSSALNTKNQRLCSQPSLPSGISKGSRLIAVESMASHANSFQISVKIDKAAPPTELHSPNAVEIEAVNLYYKAPTPHGHVSLLPDKLYRRTSDDKTTSSPTFIVKNVSFTAKSGELLAIVGPSGAGKSTLLELLAGKLQPSSPPDSILINRQPMDMATFRRMSGYVPQSDALFPHLSVRETLLFSAHLRLPSSVASAEKSKRVDALLNELRLMHVADMRVGNEDVRGISGGEKRRVSIGVDVIHDPVVLLLDEPTSGLDSASALHVIEMLRSMAKTQSRTIILSIHQPGYRIIQQINSFLLLADGHAVHHGSLQRLHYKLIAEGHKIPPQVNVLEYAIEDIASKKMMADINGHDRGFIACSTLHRHSKENKGLAGDMSDTSGREKTTQAFECQVSCKAKLAAPAFANSSSREIMFLSQRFARNVFRTYELFAARTMQAIVVGLALGLLYIHVGTNLRGVVERMGFFAFTLTFLLSSSVEALPISLQERPVIARETTRGAYRISSYLAANFIVFLPFLLTIALLYSVPVYWLVQLSSQPSAFAFFVFVVWLVLLMADAFVAFLSTIVPNYIMGNTMITGCLGTFFLFSGYFISEQDMPSYCRFLHYISLFKYPLDALLINEYTSLRGKCFGIATEGGCTFTGEDVLREVGLYGSSKWTKVLVMVFFVCLYKLMGYGVLQYKLYKISR